MKKKILIVSLAINIIAGAFVFYAFTSKAKSTNDTGGYLVMNVHNYIEFSISDGNNTLDHQDLSSNVYSKEKARSNNDMIAKKINDLKSQGYELISSNGGDNFSNYVFLKK